MPNWCQNDLTISHPDQEAMDSLVAAYKSGRMLDFACPMPPELNDNGEWYNWRVEHWGTKWDVNSDADPVVEGKAMEVSFDSAWAPPVEAMRCLAERGYTLEMFYLEPGADFGGVCIGGPDGFFDEAGNIADLPEGVDEHFADTLEALRAAEEE